MAAPYSCYLLDDEPPAHLVLSKFISRLPYLTLAGQSLDPFDGLDQVQLLKPDILFLDVEMPDMSGIAFLRSLPLPHPIVVMVTASPQYAADTYNFESVIHYLLKPVGYDKFLDAVHRVTRRLDDSPNSVQQTSTGAVIIDHLPASASSPLVDSRETVPPYFLIKEDKKLIRVAPEDIVFIEGMKDYLKLHLTTRVVVTHMTMNKLAEMLPPSQFLRINRSYIVRRQAIKEIDGNLITTLDGKRVTIGVTYRESVMKELKKNMI